MATLVLMDSTTYLLLVADLVAILVLTLGIYFPRHRRRDLVIAFVAVNVGVLGAAIALTSSNVSAGFGLGLFGVLSIIRLRSTELGQIEIAYYFISLALGLVAGLGVEPWITLILMAILVMAMALIDSRHILRGYQQQIIVLDHAITSESELHDHLHELLGATVHRVQVLRLDLVRDSTTVDVRYRNS